MKKQNKPMAFVLVAAMAAAMAPVMTAHAATTITIQAEEVSAFGHYVNGAMTKVERDAGAQSFGGNYIQQATNGADAMAWIYGNTAAPEHGETGDGMQVASWGNKFYAIKIRGTNNTADKRGSCYVKRDSKHNIS